MPTEFKTIELRVCKVSDFEGDPDTLENLKHALGPVLGDAEHSENEEGVLRFHPIDHQNRKRGPNHGD